MKTVSPQSFSQKEEHISARYRVMLPREISYEDLFMEQTWRNCGHKLRQYDTIRAIGFGDSFDVDLTVLAVTDWGVAVRLKYKPPHEIKPAKRPVSAASDGFAEIRLQYLDGTLWRLLGLDGEEIKRNMNISEARRAMQRYLEAANMYIPVGVPSEQVL